MDKKPADRQNDRLGKFLAAFGSELPPELKEHHFTQNFLCWKENIQNAIAADFPKWKETCTQVATDWGWSLSQMDKDPMLVEEALSRVVKMTDKVDCLEKMATQLEKFWKS